MKQIFSRRPQEHNMSTKGGNCWKATKRNMVPMIFSIPTQWKVILILLLLVLSTLAYLSFVRRKTRLQLSAGICNLPTVCWMPKFVNYHPDKDEQPSADENSDLNPLPKKMPSSNITNILPRMERLGGPYGLYATVYGVSTKIVHVAHPIPAKAILMGNPMSKSKIAGKKASIADSLGAVKSPAYDHFKNFSGDGVFTADGNIWKTKRASVLHCLLKGCTKDDSPESQRLEREANLAADSFILSATAISSRSVSGFREVNVVPLLQRATIGLIYRFITHHDVDIECENKRCFREGNDSIINVEENYCDETDDTQSCGSANSSASKSELTTSTERTDNDYHTQQSRRKESRGENGINPFEELSRYLEAITNIRMIILAQSRSIWFLLPRWMYQTFSSMFREEEKQMVMIRKFARAACDNAKLGSPLQMLRLKASHNPRMDNNVKNGREINKELLDEAITLLFAGQDTSAATLSWTLHLLSLHPNTQMRLAKEVRDCLSNANIGHGERISKKMVSKMTFLDAVIKESMRLYPVAPFVVRRLPDALTILSDTSGSEESVTIPKDTFACIWIYGLHRNPKLWHRANDFVPERWIDPVLQKLDDAQTKYKGAFMPFAAGPRNCVGQPLAQTILKIMLARIINECEFSDLRMKQHEEFASEEDMIEWSVHLRKDMQAGFTVLPSGGLRLVVKRSKKLN